MKTLLLLILVGLSAGCADVSSSHIPKSEKAALKKLLAPDFKFDPTFEKKTYEILAAVRKHLEPGETVDAVTFKDSNQATVIYTVRGVSIHGSPYSEAIWDGREWKIGRKWSFL
jgi:hypothetical protein